MLPFECIEHIVTYCAPRQRFTVATDFRLLFIQSPCLPLVTTVERACRHGWTHLLDAFQKHGFKPVVYLNPSWCLNHASVLEWWAQSGLNVRISNHFSYWPVRFFILRDISDTAFDWWERQYHKHGVHLVRYTDSMDF